MRTLACPAAARASAQFQSAVPPCALAARTLRVVHGALPTQPHRELRQPRQKSVRFTFYRCNNCLMGILRHCSRYHRYMFNHFRDVRSPTLADV